MIELNQSWAGPYHRMPLELPKDRAAMIAKAIEADDGACSTGAMMADPAPVAAKPSLLDELAEVAYEADKIEGSGPWSSLSDKGRESWRRKALSVARRLLEKEPSEAEVSVADRAANDVSKPWRVALREALNASRRSQLAELEGK